MVSQDTIRTGISLYRDRLNSAYELNYMANIQKTQIDDTAIQKALQVTFISDQLQDMLSDDFTEVLTDHELMYCYIFANTGSNELALAESQLDTVLNDKTPIRLRYLGMFLREKPNVKQFIKALQDEKLKQLDTSKERVQVELITQIEQLKEITAIGDGLNATNRSNLLRAIEMLGKSIGAFTDRVELSEVKATDALDKLIEMAKEAQGSDGVERYSMLGDGSSESVGLPADSDMEGSSEVLEQEDVSVND
jgi:hypothetical protein